jgi:hypothetical protein
MSIAIFLMKLGMSIPVGHAMIQGASKQKRQRLASIVASLGEYAGFSSARFAAIAAAGRSGSRGIGIIPALELAAL